LPCASYGWVLIPALFYIQGFSSLVPQHETVSEKVDRQNIRSNADKAQEQNGLQKWTSNLVGPKKGTLSSHTDHPHHPLHISTWNFLSNGFKIEKELYS